MTETLSLGPVAAEIWLALSGLALLMVGAFRGNQATRLVAGLVTLALAVALIAVLAQGEERRVAMNGLFVVDDFARFMKALVLIGAAVTLVMSLGFIRREGMERFEFPILILFATLGMLMMVSANDLMSLYIGLEVQSLALYVIAAFQRDSLRATEAGLKYFVLGALASGLLLYGCSLVYGFSGTTRFDVLAQFLSGSGAGLTAGGDVVAPVPPTGLIVGLVFIVAGLAFKVSAVPFHMWTPDVYEGAPTPITAFFSVAPKIAAIALFLRVMLHPFGDFVVQWQQIIIFISVASMLLGAFGALAQTNIKRLMAYSSIGHVGYALIGIATGTESGARGVIIYMAIYLVMNLGTFGCILAMRRKDRMVENISDLAGLSKTQPVLALALGIFMFAMAGIPPLSGFFGKLYIFLAAIESEFYVLAVIGVLASAVAAVYYLRIVKIMYFDEAAEPFDRPIGRELSLVIAAAGAVTLFFFIHPSPLLSGAQAAAASLFP